MALVAVTALAALLLRDGTYVAPPPDDAPLASVEPALATQALAELTAALAAADPAQAAAVAAPGDDAAAGLLAALARNAGALAVTDLSLRFVDAAGPVRPDGTWSAEVDGAWAFEGFDSRPAEAELVVTFRSAGDRVGVVSFDPSVAPSGAQGRLPVWLSGPVEARRAGDALVVLAEGVGGAERFARLARVAVDQARALLPAWTAGLVVEVPASPEALQEALLAPDGRYDAVAAVTTAVGRSLEPGAPVHVFVNPAVFGGLEPPGGQVVMTHEAVHVATDAPRTDVPLWLLEGFADFVALREVDLPVTTAAAQVIAQVRAEGLPAELPGAAEFDTGATHLGASYEAAWLACLVVADAGGPERLVTLYQRVSAGQDVDAVLRELVGFGVEGLTERWRQRLADVAG